VKDNGEMFIIREILWLDDIVAKIEQKHRVSMDEVEQVLHRRPKVKQLERGRVVGQDLYVALGRTEAGRYLSVFFIRKNDDCALITSARDMDAKERRRYGRK
jgi:hypothetical protein